MRPGSRRSVTNHGLGTMRSRGLGSLKIIMAEAMPGMAIVVNGV